MPSAFVDGTGRVRPGWVVVSFAVTATVAQVIFGFVASRLHHGTGPLRLDQWRVALFTWPTFFSAAIATLVCARAFKVPVGLGAPRTVFLGVALASTAMLLAVGVPVLFDEETLTLPASGLSAIAISGALQLITIAPTSVGEELLFRGVAFQALCRGIRPLPAIVLSSLLFGAVHLSNPDASLIAAGNVALVGLWFGLVTWRVSLWASIGLHVTWNYCEGFVFGQPVSGIQPGASLLDGTWSLTRGFWSGGAFGPEASGWTTCVLLLGIAAVVVLTPANPVKIEAVST